MLSRKQDTILNIGDFSTTLRFPPKTLAANIFMLEPIQDNNNYKPHAKINQIYPCLLKLSRKQESVTNGRYYYIPLPLSGGGEKKNKMFTFQT